MSITVALKNVCLCCGQKRTTQGNYCDSCHRIKFGMTPNAARNLLETGAQALPELASKFRSLMGLPPDRPEVVAAALTIRAMLLRSEGYVQTAMSEVSENKNA